MHNNGSPAIVTAADRFLGGGGGFARAIANGESMDEIRANSNTLEPYEWDYFDRAIVKVFRHQATAIADFQKYGLIKDIDGLENTYFRFDQINDFNAAELSMQLGARAGQDNPEFTANYIPLPICHKDYYIDVRQLRQSRKNNNPNALDVTGAQLATAKVVEKLEEMIIAGVTYVVGGKTLYGICNHTNVNGVTLATYGNWDASAGGGPQIIKCVNAMIQASVNDKCYGPYGIYIPPAYVSPMNYKADTYTSISVGEQLRKLASLVNEEAGLPEGSIKYIRPHAKIAANTIALVPLDPTRNELIRGMEIQNVQWEAPGGFVLCNKVMAIYAPWIKPDVDGNVGIVKAA